MSLLTETSTTRLISTSMLASKSECLNYADIQSDVSLAMWKNEADQVLTHNKNLHTLSIYIEGGQDAYRTDMKSCHGGPGKICFFPADHSSQWIIGEQLRLLHLYFTDTHLNYLAMTAFDIDPRVLHLPDLTFKSDPRLSEGMQQLQRHLDQSDMSNRLLLQDLQQQLILYLLEQYSERKAAVIRGGLSPAIKSRIIDYMQAHIDQDIKLEQLANEACQSTYHFSHMFKQSTALSPYQFLVKQRMQLAATKLRSDASIAQIAEDCGYSNSSRFARAFRAAYGVTPKAYQQAF